MKNNQKFIYRVACLFIKDGKVLLHRAEMDDFYALAGGSVEFGETSVEAIEREMKEELGATVKILRLVWVAENFFEYQTRECHEIGLYYLAEFTSDSKKFYSLDEFEGVESESIQDQQFKLHFKWISLDDLNNFEIKPTFLKTGLLDIPSTTQVRINRNS